MTSAAKSSTLGKLSVNHVWDAQLEGGGISALALSPSQDTILLGVEAADNSIATSVQQLAVEDGTCTGRTLLDTSQVVNSLAFSPSGQQIIGIDTACNIHSWELSAFENRRQGNCAETNPASKDAGNEAGPCAALSSNGNFPIHAAVVSRCGSSVYTGWSKGDEFAVKVLCCKDGTVMGSWPGHTGPIISLAFNTSGDLLLTGSYDKTARIWEVSSGTTVRVLAGHSAGVRGMVVSPDGVLCYTAAADNTIKVWHLERGYSLGLMLGRHPEGCWPNQLLLSPDGQLLVSASTGPMGGGNILVFRARGDRGDSSSGACMGKFCHIPPGCRGDVTGVVFLADSRTLISAASDGTVKMWRLDFLNVGRDRPEREGKQGQNGVAKKAGLEAGFL